MKTGEKQKETAKRNEMKWNSAQDMQMLRFEMTRTDS